MRQLPGARGSHEDLRTHRHGRACTLEAQGSFPGAPGVLTPLQRSQLQVLQDQLAQQTFHARLACALQGGVTSVKENPAPRQTPGQEASHSQCVPPR